MPVAPVLYCSRSYGSKSYFLFLFNSVTTFSLRTLRVRAFCAHEWRLREDKSSTVGPRMPYPLLFGCEPWRKTSLKCLTASETKPSLPFIQQCIKTFGRPNVPGDEFIHRMYEGAGWRDAELNCWHMPYPNLLLPSGLWPQWLFNNVNLSCIFPAEVIIKDDHMKEHLSKDISRLIHYFY